MGKSAYPGIITQSQYTGCVYQTIQLYITIPGKYDIVTHMFMNNHYYSFVASGYAVL